MRRVASVWTAAAIACALAGCNESRPIAAGLNSEGGCVGCHSGPGEAPPFRDQTGSTDPNRLTVGAHDAHLHTNLTAPISCAECHTTPRAITDPGHLEDSPDDIRFGPLASTGGASPAYVAPGCAAVYCHGNFPGGNRGNTPSWIGGAGDAECGACHWFPPTTVAATGRHAEHVGVAFQGTALTCNTCHGPVAPETHLNGVKNVILTNWDPQFRTCALACHQARAWGQ